MDRLGGGKTHAARSEVIDDAVQGGQRPSPQVLTRSEVCSKEWRKEVS